MLKKLPLIGKALAVLFALLILSQLTRAIARKNPLADLEFTPIELTAALTNNISDQTVAPLTDATKARIDAVVQSETLGPVMRPPPMALLGIAGKDVMLRTATGQTGLIRVGDELGGVKLLRIGINRILIEEGQVMKELTLFSGFGSESLLPKGKTNSP